MGSQPHDGGRSVVLYCTHLLTEEIRREYDRLSDEIGTSHDVVLLLDEEASRSEVVPSRTFEFSSAGVFAEFGNHMDGPATGSLMPGCLDLAILHYARRNPGYEYYWRVEYDVRFSGSWNHFFSAFETNDADLLSSLVQTRRERPDWAWWPTLSVPPQLDASSVNPIRAFHPVCRISQPGLRAVEVAYERGWKGHYEVTLPTILHHGGYRIEDFGGRGSFVAAGNEGRFYSNVPRENGMADGSFVWRPCRSEPGSEPNMLWHPVKQCEEETSSGPQVAKRFGKPELNRRSTTDLIRGFVPKSLKRRIKRSRLYVRHRSQSENIYHCCVQKTASRWVRQILRDPRVFRACGLESFDYNQTTFEGGIDPRKMTEIRFKDPLPPGTIVSPLYLDYGAFRSIPKPASYRAFFVMRDPRDILVSWYLSLKHHHPDMGGSLSPIKTRLQEMPQQEGLLHAAHMLSTEADLFPALSSWAEAAEDPNVMLVKYEDLTAQDNVPVFSRLFDHCDVSISEADLRELLADYSFEKLSGRKRGEENLNAHLRKGVPGDWKNHLDDEVLERLAEETGDLVSRLGYE